MSETQRRRRSDSGRMRPTTIDEICDRFAALPPDGRDGLLLTLQQIHRVLCKRDARQPEVMSYTHGSGGGPEQARELPLAEADEDRRDQLDNPNFNEERCPPRE